MSILPTVSKIFEKVLETQSAKYFETRFFDIPRGFRKVVAEHA
jgi:hypothetical protein